MINPPHASSVPYGLTIDIAIDSSLEVEEVASETHSVLSLSICLPILFIAQGSGYDLFDPQWPTGDTWLWLFGVGFFATVSHMMMTYALSSAPSVTLAPL